MAQYNVPREIRTIAQRAIDYNLSLPISQRAAYEDGPNGKRQQGTGMATAQKLVSGRVSDQQIDLMAAWSRAMVPPIKTKDKISLVRRRSRGLYGVVVRPVHG